MKPPAAPDSDHVWEATFGLPEQFALGAATAASVAAALPRRDGPVSSVAAFGMGGSGIGHDVLAAIAAPLSPVPVVVCKDYEVPAFVGPSTLVLTASFSGNTEETLAAFSAAHGRGAHIVAVCGGGRLAALADDAGAAVVPLPRDIPHPRLAIGAMSVAPLVVMEAMGLLPGASGLIAAAVEQLSYRRDQLASGDMAARVATRVGRTIPLVYGGGAIGKVAATRWKCQVNENAKS
ncbi:MAG TPA: SIS domain-containing protein, partial [Acidimicrobiales bacterium]|nr:SIS domain-containing protein [Acidimicrobiales bacterium]